MENSIGIAEEKDLESSFIYYDTFNECELLTSEEQKELLQRKQNGDEAAREKLICSNMGLVFKVAAQKYRQLSNIKSLSFTLDDLVQEGMVGLIKAVDVYDATNYADNKFSTYAWHWIRMAINKFLVQLSRTIRLPDHKVEKMLFVYAAAQALEKTLGRQPITSEIFGYINQRFSEKEIEELLVLMDNSMMSLDAPCDSDDPDCTLGEIVAGTDEDESQRKEQIQRTIDLEVGRLRPKEQLVINATCGLQGLRKRTLEEASDFLFANGYKNKDGRKLSRQGVAQIRDKALKKIKPRVLKQLYGQREM